MNNRLQRVGRIPKGMLCYCVFAVAATLFSIAATIYDPLGAATVPYTGWSGGLSYSFTLFFAISACIFLDSRLTSAVISFLKLFVVFGVIDLGWALLDMLTGASDFGNPYLTYSPWRPLFTIGLPATWWFILSPRGSETDEQGQATNETMHPSRGPTVA